jgi:hemerythrin-like domain-containing protein
MFPGRREFEERRTFLRRAAGSGLAVIVAGVSSRAGATPAPKKERSEDDDVSPTEDLMREHGILRRLLLVYGEALRRIDIKTELKPEPIARSAEIVRAFIEDYHERDEEEFIFPRFDKAGKLVDLVTTLRAQHQAGRKLTAEILRLASPAALASPTDRATLAETMRRFVRMYEPHAAREDTVLFPAFRALVGEKELDRLQGVFEEKEKALPGGGFEKMVATVTTIEESMGIADLAEFTPKAS